MFRFRTDLWTVYTDYEVKYGEVDKARNVLETALTSCTKKKSVIALLKKYYLL